MKGLSTAAMLIFLCSLCLNTMAQLPDAVKVSKIWDKAEHSAFTDLIRFKGNFYCSFREGTGHVPGGNGRDGTVRILRSADGESWESVAVLEKGGIDLRDPKLSVTPDGRLMVIMGGSVYERTELRGRTPQVSFSNWSGCSFSAPEKVVIDPEIVSWGDWIWRVTWHKGTGYAIDYQTGPEGRQGPTALYLLKTEDGKHFDKVSKLDLDGFPNEATVRFDREGTMYVLIRRELGDKMGVLATSKLPFTDWKYEKLSIRLGGPNFVFTRKGKMIVGTRLYEPEAYTGILVENAGGKLEEIIRLPSGGDNSYPGMFIRKGKLYVSYYSSHDGKTSIYFARIPLSYIEGKLSSGEFDPVPGTNAEE